MKIRMFISIPLKDPSVLQPVLSDVRRMDKVRASPLSQMHITVRFIGDIDDGKTKKVAACIADAVEGMEPFTITVKGAGRFPDKPSSRRTPILWVGVSPEDVLRGIAERLSANLKAANISFDEKPFKGHITVGRCQGPTDTDEFIEKYRDVEFDSFECNEILIMRSELLPTGAKHTVLERVGIGS